MRRRGVVLERRAVRVRKDIIGASDGISEGLVKMSVERGGPWRVVQT